jgi:hypothetical protein
LGKPTEIEDKIVQKAVSMRMGAVFEQGFLVGWGECDLCPLPPKPDGLPGLQRV